MSILILAASVLLAWVPTILATSVLLAWDANPEPDLAGYKIHVGIQSLPRESTIQTLDVGNVTQSPIRAWTTRPSISSSLRLTTTPAREWILQRGHLYSYAPVEDKIRYWPRLNLMVA